MSYASTSNWLRLGSRYFDFARVVALNTSVQPPDPDGTAPAWVMIGGDVLRIEFHGAEADALRAYLDDAVDLPDPTSIMGIGEVKEIPVALSRPRPTSDIPPIDGTDLDAVADAPLA